MKFIFADSIDVVDPGYDMINDRNSPGRRPYWDDVYPHEILGHAPYDGILVSKGIVGDHRITGKYSQAQAQRFRREGARKFLRLDNPKFNNLAIFGDCGAFSYHKEEIPPHTPEEMVEFYDDCDFTHGCSVDHIIFDFDETLHEMEGGTEDARRRFEITLENADQFLQIVLQQSNRFIPMGVVQGWSPGSMAVAASRLVKMGYKYLAIGGMVPLKSPQIRSCLAAIRQVIPNHIQLHILGFAKADDIVTFLPFNITSFDTTSPLIRAFKDNKQNYFQYNKLQNKIDYFTAIRVPQSIENNSLKILVKTGVFKAEDLTALEKKSLDALRAFDRGDAGVEDALDPIMEYNAAIIYERPLEDVSDRSKLDIYRDRYLRTLTNKPWKKCACAICQQSSVEVMIFRASNRNKRRGIHNLYAYRSMLNEIDHGSISDDQY